MEYLNSLTRFIQVMGNLESHEKNIFPGLESHGFMFGRFVTADVKVRRVQDRDITAQTACI